MLILRKPWTSQPQGAVQVNPRWGLRPEIAWVASNPSVDWSRGSVVARTANATPTTQPVGVGIKTPITAGSGMSFTGGNTAAQTAVTFIAVFRFTSASAYQIVLSSNVQATGAGFVLAADLNGSNFGVVKAGVENSPANVALTAGVTYTLIASNRQSSGEYYVLALPYNGGDTIRAAASFTSVSTAGNGTYGISRGKNTDASLTGDIFMGFMSFAFLPENAARELLLNPWALFAPRSIYIPTAAAAASSLPTLSASTFVPGSVIATGWRPRVTATY